MDRDEIEMAKLIKDLKKQQLAKTKLNKAWRALEEQLNSGELNSLKPLWRENARRRDLQVLKCGPKKEYLYSGTSIIKDVNIKKLFSAMANASSSFLKKEKISENGKIKHYHIFKIIKNWSMGKKLLPPFVMLHPTMDELFTHDGKHRLVVALHFKSKSLPIMVPTNQKKEILTLLGRAK